MVMLGTLIVFESMECLYSAVFAQCADIDVAQNSVVILVCVVKFYNSGTSCKFVRNILCYSFRLNTSIRFQFNLMNFLHCLSTAKAFELCMI